MFVAVRRITEFPEIEFRLSRVGADRTIAHFRRFVIVPQFRGLIARRDRAGLLFPMAFLGRLPGWRLFLHSAARAWENDTLTLLYN